MRRGLVGAAGAGRQCAPVPEVVAVADRRHQCRSGDGTDTGTRMGTACELVVLQVLRISRSYSSALLRNRSACSSRSWTQRATGMGSRSSKSRTSRRSRSVPRGTTYPNSAIRPRTRLSVAVRSSTKPWRTRCRLRSALLLHGFNGHEAHIRAADRLADRLRIVAVVLAALAVGCDELRRHQLHRMTGCRETARPFMGARARLHADQAGRQSRHELSELPSRDRTPHRHHSLRVDAVHGEGIFCQVDSKRRNCIHGTSPFRKDRIRNSILTPRCRFGTGKSLTFVRRRCTAGELGGMT